MCSLIMLISLLSNYLFQRTGKSPKTPRTLTRLIASSTGHVDSPETLIVGKMVSKGRPTKRRTTLVLHQAKTTQPVGFIIFNLYMT